MRRKKSEKSLFIIQMYSQNVMSIQIRSQVFISEDGNILSNAGLWYPLTEESLDTFPSINIEQSFISLYSFAGWSESFCSHMHKKLSQRMSQILKRFNRRIFLFPYIHGSFSSHRPRHYSHCVSNRYINTFTDGSFSSHRPRQHVSHSTA